MLLTIDFVSGEGRPCRYVAFNGSASWFAIVVCSVKLSCLSVAVEIKHVQCWVQAVIVGFVVVVLVGD